MKLRLKHATIIVLAIACVTAILISVSQDRIGLSELGYVTKLKISIVYDNEALNKSLEASWGFACIVELKDESILFDTGGNSQILLSNMANMNINISKIKTIVLSHIHADHTGGLAGFLKVHNEVKVYLPASFPKPFKRSMESYGCTVIEVSKPMKIREGIAVTGEMGFWIKEQSLIINTPKGAIVITGCAHPGIVNIVKRAKEIAGKVYTVLGGFHLMGYSENEVLSIISQLKDLGVEVVAPCHCTGDLAKMLFEEKFGENYIRIGVGAIIELNFD